MVRLVISDNEGATTVVPLLRDEITIGRKEGNTIRLTERNISRTHAHLLKQNGVYKLRDLDSYNGVTINGRRVQGESDVNTGDQIQIGDYTILVEEEAAKVAPPEPPAASKRPVTPARFMMLSDPSPGVEFAFPTERAVRLGRSEDVDCPINHRSVSREHAEVRCTGGTYSLHDLGSANGVSVNGQVEKEHVLKSGDVIELGQVAFRYVEPGEHYFFDPAEVARYRSTVVGKQRANLKLAAMVLGAALVIAVVVVMSGGEEPIAKETVTPLHGTQPAAGATLADDGYDKAVNACRSALAGMRFAEALAHATLALKVRSGASDATACQTQAQSQYEEEQAYVRGKSALQAGDPEAAYQELTRLSPSSPFRSKPEVALATEQAARARLAHAKTLLSSNRAEAVRIAQSVAAMTDAPTSIVSAAEQLLSEARKESAQEPSFVARSAPTRGSAAAAPHATHAARAAPATPRAAAAPSAGSTMDVASACLARGDNDCVIHALNGRANSAQELGLLIETYRAMGDTKQAQKNMAVYVKRFPTARRADAYRRMLELQGQ